MESLKVSGRAERRAILDKLNGVPDETKWEDQNRPLKAPSIA
jgi:hypothetical protein